MSLISFFLENTDALQSAVEPTAGIRPHDWSKPYSTTRVLRGFREFVFKVVKVLKVFKDPKDFKVVKVIKVKKEKGRKNNFFLLVLGTVLPKLYRAQVCPTP